MEVIRPILIELGKTNSKEMVDELMNICSRVDEGGDVNELRHMIEVIRPALADVGEERSTKMLRDLDDLCIRIEQDGDTKIGLIKESIEWARTQKLQNRVIRITHGDFSANIKLDEGNTVSVSLLRSIFQLDHGDFPLLMHADTFLPLRNIHGDQSFIVDDHKPNDIFTIRVSRSPTPSPTHSPIQKSQPTTSITELTEANKFEEFLFYTRVLLKDEGQIHERRELKNSCAPFYTSLLPGRYFFISTRHGPHLCLDKEDSLNVYNSHHQSFPVTVVFFSDEHDFILFESDVQVCKNTPISGPVHGGCHYVMMGFAELKQSIKTDEHLEPCFVSGVIMSRQPNGSGHVCGSSGGVSGLSGGPVFNTNSHHLIGICISSDDPDDRETSFGRFSSDMINYCKEITIVRILPSEFAIALAYSSIHKPETQRPLKRRLNDLRIERSSKGLNPYNAITIINLPINLEADTTHRYGPNTFKLHRLPTPRLGNVLGLVGTNGIGKSTALKILHGNLKPNLGNFSQTAEWEKVLQYFRGSELQNYFIKIVEDKFKPVMKMQYVDQIPKAFKRPGQENKTVGSVLKDKCEMDNFDSVVDRLELRHLLERKPFDLSGGELQRFAIAICLVSKADVYMFDEPSSYLDVRQRLEAARAIRECVKPTNYVMVVEHDLAVLDYLSDFVCILYGVPGVYGVVTMPSGVREGINHFLDGFIPSENMRFRENALSFKVTDQPDREEQDRNHMYQYPKMTKTLGTFKLEIEEGSFTDSEIVVLLGENGTGKSTLIKMLAGKLQPDDESADVPELSISYKPQTISPSYEGTVQQLLFDKIAPMLTHPTFKTDVLNPMCMEPIMDRDVQTSR